MFESNSNSGGRSLFRDEESLLSNPITWAIVAVVLAGGGAAWWYTHKSAPKPAPPPVVQQPKPAAPAPAEPAIRNPVPEVPPEADKDMEPLPPLNESDVAVQTGLAKAIGQRPFEEFLVPEDLVRHIVVTVDNLPRKKVPVERRPVKATPGSAIVSGTGDSTTLSEANYARYAPFIRFVQSTDAAQLTNFYFRYYPLFQQAYEDLGYPNAYFNDRVIEVIDHLLATPDVRGPVQLVQPKVFYEYADPKLENRSAGQKLLIRMGPENAAALKKKLREVRANIVGRA
jgi:Protein of unknown function (DUF3014)